jgi:nitrogen fixation protein
VDPKQEPWLVIFGAHGLGLLSLKSTWEFRLPKIKQDSLLKEKVANKNIFGGE